MSVNENRPAKNAPISMPANREAFVRWATQEPEGWVSTGWQSAPPSREAPIASTEQRTNLIHELRKFKESREGIEREQEKLIAVAEAEELPLVQKFREPQQTEREKVRIVRRLLPIRDRRSQAEQKQSLALTQIRIIDNHIHNLEIVALIDPMALPQIKEINRAFVNAQEYLAQLRVLSNLSRKTNSTLP